MNDLISNFARAGHNGKLLKNAQDTINSFIKHGATVWITDENGETKVLKGKIKLGYYEIIPVIKE